jgi:hypothetical protein
VLFSSSTLPRCGSVFQAGRVEVGCHSPTPTICNLQVSLGMLSRGEDVSQPCPGPNRQHQSLLSHRQNLRSSPSVAQQPLLQLQERQVQRTQELGLDRTFRTSVKPGTGRL